MSWIDDINQDFTIQTGDGKLYKVYANKYSKNVAWNHDIFSFIGVKGQLGKKEQQLARRFPLEFYFQGADHLETSQAFENSLDSKDPIIINHPLYGNIVCHIFSVIFSNSENELNVTKITGEAIETLTEQGLLSFSPEVRVAQLQMKVYNSSIDPEIIDYPIKVSDGTQLLATAKANKNNGLKIITIPDEANLYTNVFNQAATAIGAIIASPVLAMAALGNFITMPQTFTAIVNDRLSFLESQLQNFLATIGINSNPTQKKLFEIQSTNCVAAMCVTATTPIGNEYLTSIDVLNIATRLQNNFNLLITTLDSLQVSNGGINQYYIFSPDTYYALMDCVNTTLGNLIVIALAGKQERFVNIPEDSNAIILAHRYYGCDNDDVNLQYFCDTNNLTYDEMILIKKGTQIVYYI